MMKCIVIDDETLARRLLSDHIAKIPGIEVVAQCENPLQARAELAKHKIDLMFLDIQMPEITGIDFIKTLKDKPLTILTTAFPDYALQGYELDIIDYLLKPISFERFYQAVNKAMDYLQHQSGKKSVEVLAENESDIYEKGYFYVKADYKIVRVNFCDILFVEGMKEYVRIHTENKRIVTYISLQKMTELLPAEHFFRIHKSYIVNLQKIDTIQGNLITIGGQQVSVSKSQHSEFIERINRRLIN
ncbi:MAG TPA: LytTR family DNA-binding domain-containing protein [Bacteroidales bacterium]|nr:LytTR family DNA-binding domain-containing protein [Bacteroidales bacterium]